MIVASPLRDDLKLHDSFPFPDGAPGWTIQDPVSNRFFRIGWLEFECLLRWHWAPIKIAQDISEHTALKVYPEQVIAFTQFLEHNHLLRVSEQKLEQLKKIGVQKKWRNPKWWLHTYLFVRVPLVRPQRMLHALQPWVEPFFSQLFLWLTISATVLGLLLVVRQWETFTHSFLDMLSPQGLAGFALALIVSKTLHEMGHALVATRLGVRVAHMGVAFVVLWPMLYTDTGESWRLRHPRQRLAISVAGITTEIGLAGLATLAWALLDDGLLRQAMLYLATTGWVLSLALNVSPFMRFDGYFILSDLLHFPNLHERSGAMAKAWMRRKLLGWEEPDPEFFQPAQRWKLRLFAYVTWLYRLSIFLGIALAVYYFFFKALGIFLLLVELWWFVAKPVWMELMVWRKRWEEVKPRKGFLLGSLLALPFLLVAFPWSSSLEAPGIARAERQQLIYSPQAARVTQLVAMGPVQEGQLLVQLAMPDLEFQQWRAQINASALAQQLPQLLGLDQGLERQQAMALRLQEQLAETHALEQERSRLHLKADFQGEWRDLDPLLSPGSWVDTRTPLGVLIDPTSWIVDAYVEQQDVQRITEGGTAKFWPQNMGVPLSASVVSVDTTRVQSLPYAMLDARHGGTLATYPDDRVSRPLRPLYRVRLRLHEAPPLMNELRGRAQIQAQRSSWLWHALQNGAAVLIRESGF